MRRGFRALLIAAALAFVHRDSQAAVLYESGTLGTTGVPYGTTDGTNINPFVYAGVRFELTQSVVTSQVGGHFVAFTGGTFFGAIVKLSGPNDFPDSGNLSTADVLGTTSLTFPVLSSETFGNLSLPLSPGWYALVFGSGLFGVDGRGASVRNAPDVGNPGFIGFQPNSGLTWYDYSVPSANGRFVVLGNVVPELPSIQILITCFCVFVVYSYLLRSK